MRIEEAIEKLASGKLSVRDTASAILGVEPELEEGLGDFLKKVKGKALTAGARLEASLKKGRTERFGAAKKRAEAAKRWVEPAKAPKMGKFYTPPKKKESPQKKPSFYGRAHGPAEASPSWKKGEAIRASAKAKEERFREAKKAKAPFPGMSRGKRTEAMIQQWKERLKPGSRQK